MREYKHTVHKFHKEIQYSEMFNFFHTVIFIVSAILTTTIFHLMTEILTLSPLMCEAISHQVY